MTTKKSSRIAATNKGKNKANKNEEASTPSPSNVNSPAQSNEKQIQNSTDSMEEDKEQSEKQQQEEEITSTLKELDIKRRDPNYDSIDEYDSEELIEKVDSYLNSVAAKKNKNEKVIKKNTKGKAPAATTTTKTKRTRVKKQASPAKSTKSVKTAKAKNKIPTYDHERVQYLTEKYKDEYWKFHPDNSPNMLNEVNQDHPLKLEKSLDHSNNPIVGMTLSKCGVLLATFCTFGSISIWDCENDFKLLRKIRDVSETQIDEFYCGLFQEDNIVAAGKLKDRYRWSEDDDDNHILPCPIKIFDMVSCKLIARLEGHAEEILCVKSLKFDNENYFISTSQDGYIIKWHMDSDWVTLKEKKTMGDGETCMAFTVSFLPNTGNKYFLGACDAHVKLYDFEEAQVMQTFEDIYSSYCDCGKFINWMDADYYMNNQAKFIDHNAENNNNKADNEQEKEVKKEGKGKEKCEESKVNIDGDDEDIKMKDADDEQYAWFITRGAELCDVSEGVTSTPNTCTLHRLIYPKKSGDPFKLEEIKRYKDKDYHANSWLVKIASNGRYIFAPTMNGQVYIFNLLTGQVSGVLKEHEDIEVRDIIVHPYFPLLISCSDDGTAKVYNLSQ